MATDLPNTEALAARVRRLHRDISRLQRELLDTLTQLEDSEAWIEEGARDMAHWTTMQLGISRWKAERWQTSGRALADAPRHGRRLRTR